LPLSAVEIAKRSASNCALRETIGRQLRANYDTSQPVPKQLLAFLQRLQRDEDKSSPLTVVPDTAKPAAVVLLADARENLYRMNLLLSHLRENKAILADAIGTARETIELSQRRREMRHTNGLLRSDSAIVASRPVVHTG
jgi:hypothetical protein